MKDESKKQPAARDQIKLAALRLFAVHGIDGVTVRQIVDACGQKNHAAVSYYFGTKEALVRELVVDGARLIDIRRNALLDTLEDAGAPMTVTQVAEALVYPSIDLGGEGEEDSYIRFIFMLTMNQRALFMDALENRWNSGYLRCLDHLRRLLPHLSPAMQNQRFVFMGAYVACVLAFREAALSDRSRPHAMWRAQGTLADFIVTLTAMLEAPLAQEGGQPAARRGKPRSIVGSVGMILD